jgi:hypothetical protein
VVFARFLVVEPGRSLPNIGHLGIQNVKPRGLDALVVLPARRVGLADLRFGDGVSDQRLGSLDDGETMALGRTRCSCPASNACCIDPVCAASNDPLQGRMSQARQTVSRTSD